MSKEYTKELVIKNKKRAIQRVNSQLEKWIADPSNLKKANLLSYWLKDYMAMVDFESKFDPKKNLSYKRGDIIKVNFGFNVGSEFGGLHYAVVIDKNNHHNSPVITVVPLTSIKSNKELHSNNVSLGNDLYKKLNQKYKNLNDNLMNSLIELNVIIELLTEKSPDERNETEIKLYREVLQKQTAAQEDFNYLKKIKTEIDNMKQGSIALVNQITTISKIRIYDPKTIKGILSGVSLSKENMELINEKIEELYIF